jgi:hypothetical protein
MWPWSKIRELEVLLAVERQYKEKRKAFIEQLEEQLYTPNPDAWRTVVIDEENAEYLNGFRSITVLGRDLTHVVNSLIDDKRIEDARLEFDRKVAASIERLADAKVVPASYPETIYSPAPGVSKATMDALRKAGKDAKAKAPRRRRG